MHEHLSARLKSLEKQICDEKISIFKTIVHDAVRYPEKLNEIKTLVFLFYRGDLDLEEIDKLQKEIDVIFKDCMINDYNVKDFLYKVKENNKDIEKLEEIINIGMNDGDGLSEINFHLDQDKLEVIKYTVDSYDDI